jgi:acyl phosphate:glycerol-3-phosphate acyltransferase
MSPTDILLLFTVYLIGAIPFGLIISWLFSLQDPRTTGSKSIGATNIFRSGNKTAAALTLLFDALKGSVAVLLAVNVDPSLTHLAGIMVVLGHIFPIWLKFHGGKGVATALGVICVLSIPLAILCLVSWLMVALTTRYSSLASLITVLLSPLYAYFLSEPNLISLCIVLAILLVWTHRSNIARLLTGRETKIGNSNPPETPQE